MGQKIITIFLVLFFIAMPLATLAQEGIEDDNSWNDEYLDDDYYPVDDFYDDPDYFVEVVRGLILELEEVENPLDRDFVMLQQFATVEIQAGSLKGQVFEVENELLGNPGYDIEMKKGQQLYFLAEFVGDELIQLNVSDQIRDRYAYWLIGLFVVLILAVGKVKGFKALLSLTLTIVLILKFFLPQLTRGGNPILLAIAVAAFVTVFTLGLIGGINNKSFAAILGTVGGVLVAGFLALVVGELAQLTGFSSQEAQMLQFADSGISNIRGILFAGILIGSLGAVMDVAMSIASACGEMVSLNKTISRSKLMKSGMNVGRDIMGTMSNTLILAYAGSTIPLMLLFYIYETPLVRIINMDLIATEIVRAISGTIGLIIAIPLTAVLAGLFMGAKESSQNSSKES